MEKFIVVGNVFDYYLTALRFTYVCEATNKDDLNKSLHGAINRYSQDLIKYFKEMAKTGKATMPSSNYKINGYKIDLRSFLKEDHTPVHISIFTQDEWFEWMKKNDSWICDTE